MSFIYNSANAIKEAVLENQHMFDNPEVLDKEINEIRKDWNDVDVKMVILSVVEEKAMIQNLGVMILYEIVNNLEWALLERFYYPEPKLIKFLKRNNIPFFSKESFNPLKNFDILGFSLYYPLQYLGIPECLKFSGIEPLAKDRGEDDPLIICGGAAVVNPEPAYSFIDAFVIGDGEKAVEEILLSYRKCRDKNKQELLLDLSKIEGVYIPSFYKEVYFDSGAKKGQIKGRELVDSSLDVPMMVKKANVDLDDYPPVIHYNVINSEGFNIGVNAVELSRGCGNRCFFCSGSYRTLPYRERNLESIKNSFYESKLSTGCNSCTPYSFNYSDYSDIYRLMVYLYSIGYKVQMSSQRMDFFDFDFGYVSFKSGTLRITFAIEAGSQRLRDKINKNLSEEQILESIRQVLIIGFAKVKIYMISGLPETEENDILEALEIAKKIIALRDEIQGEDYNTRFTMSFTPFTAKANTPLQYSKTWDVDEEGIPFFRRELDPIIDKLKEVGMSLKVSTHSKVSSINQVFSLGDRRLSPIIHKVWKDGLFNYKGGLSLGNDEGAQFAFRDLLKKVGVSYEFYFREKDRDEIFSWDFIDMGWKKGWLRDSYFNNFKNGVTLDSCLIKCSSCGVCSKKQLKDLKDRSIKVLEDRKIKLSDYLSLLKADFKHRLRFKIDVDVSMRYIHSTKIKFRLLSSLWKVFGVDVVNDKVRLVSDPLNYRNWEFGKDYGELSLYSNLGSYNKDDTINKLNSNLEGIRFLDYFVIGKRAFSSIDKDGYSLYKVEIPRTVVSSDRFKVLAKEYLAQDEIIIKAKRKADFGETWETYPLNIKDQLHDIFVSKDGININVYILASGRAFVYNILLGMLKMRIRSLYKFPVERVSFISSRVSSGGLFSSYCEDCGNIIEEDIFGDLINDRFCIKHSVDRGLI